MLRTLLAPAVALTLAACTGGGSDHAGHTAADTSATASGGTAAASAAAPAAYSDARFLADMTAHHRMALDMTRMAATMASNADIKAMAATMDADQSREIDEMTALLRGMGETVDTSAHAGMDHSGMDHAAMGHGAGGSTMTHDDMGMPMTMDELRAARPFDRAWLVSMIGHHSTAITMSAEAQHRSQNADVRRLATTITRAQADEIGRMQRLLDAMPAPTAR